MIRVATKLSRIARTTQVDFSLYNSPPHFLSLQSSPHTSFFSTNQEFKINPVAVQTINYAYSLSRSLKTDDSYAQGLLMLEQCESNQTDDSSKGLVLLAMSKPLSERGNFDDAKEKLDKFLELNFQSMHEGEDAAALEGLDSSSLFDGLKMEDLNAHLRAFKGLVELVRGNPESSESYFEDARDRISSASIAALSYAEFLHTKKNFSSAKELYQKVIQGVPENNEFCDPDNLTACSIAILPCAEDLSLAAICALGQLAAYMGNFADSEEILTRSLTTAEEHYGSPSSKDWSCFNLHSSHVQAQGNSGTLKFANDSRVANRGACRRDVIALARGGYAETVCVQQNRKAEGECLMSGSGGTRHY